nr:hypothetical protein [Tanacetum cinerariifolium]
MVLAINKKPVTWFHDIEDDAKHWIWATHIDTEMGNIYGPNKSWKSVGLPATHHPHTTSTNNISNAFGYVGESVNRSSGLELRRTRLLEPQSQYERLYFCAKPTNGHNSVNTRTTWSHRNSVHRYGLYVIQWIVEVNGKPTPNLEAFVNVTKEIEGGEFVRVKTVHFNGKPKVLTLKQDLHYWPTWELNFDQETAMWQRKTIKLL